MFQLHCKVMTFIDLEMSHHSLLQKPWGSLSCLKEYLNCSWAPTQTVTITQLMLCALGLLIHPFVIITGWWLLSLDSPSPLPAEPGVSTLIDQGSFPLLSVFTVQWRLGFSMCVLVFQFSGELPEVWPTPLSLSNAPQRKTAPSFDRQMPVTVSMELATLTLISSLLGKAPVYLWFPQKFHPECPK